MPEYFALRALFVDELDVLPPGSAVVDAFGKVWQRPEYQHGPKAAWGGWFADELLSSDSLDEPVRLVYVPGMPTRAHTEEMIANGLVDPVGGETHRGPQE
jgi:hypothetical protein